MKEDDEDYIPPFPGSNDEDVWDKMKRKFGAEPYVPIGFVVTVGFFIGGLRAMHLRKKTQQFWMRGRVAAQGITFALMALAASTGYLKKPSAGRVHNTIEDNLEAEIAKSKASKESKGY